MGLIKHDTKKEYERMEVNFHAFLTSELSGGGWRLHSSAALSMAKNLPVPFSLECGYFLEAVFADLQRINLFVAAEYRMIVLSLSSLLLTTPAQWLSSSGISMLAVGRYFIWQVACHVYFLCVGSRLTGLP